MFYAWPPVLNLLVLLLPIVGFRIYDFWSYKTAPAYEDQRTQFKRYWVYRTRAPAYPPIRLYAVQAIWAGVMLIPLRD